jgi:hypothetical protein
MARQGYDFDFSALSSRPKKQKDEVPLWCDFIELLCIIGYDGTLGRGEMYDDIFDNGKGVVYDGDDEDEDVEDSDDNPDLSGSVESQLSGLGSRHAQRSDKKEFLITSWIDNLVSRGEILGSLYPFEVDDTRTTLTFKKDLSESNKLYLFLLLASNLHLFSGKLSVKITSDFEYVCLLAQKCMFASDSKATGIEFQSHIFGKSPGNQGVFVGTIANKFTKLGELIQSRNLDTNIFKSNNTGDGGIDLISVIKFTNDTAFGLPLILSQCACSYDDWKGKQEDHQPGNYRHLNLFDVEYLRLIFIPFFYRNQTGQWFQPFKIKLSVIDRLRIISILTHDDVDMLPYISVWVDLLLTPSEGARNALATSMAQRVSAP